MNVRVPTLIQIVVIMFSSIHNYLYLKCVTDFQWMEYTYANVECVIIV